MELKAVDLFAGGGGLTLGFFNAGFKISAAFDSWNAAIELYKANFKGHPIIERDLSSDDVANEIRAFRPDVIIGGPPCQDFSSAGKRDEGLGRANLTLSFARIVGEVRPPYFVMENVSRAINSKTFAEAKGLFKRAGYGLSIRILDASLCGVPQLRKRLFVIGELNGKDGFLDYSLDAHLSKERMTLREYFGDTLDFKHYYRHPRSYFRRAVFSIDEPSPTVRGVNRPVPKGYPGHRGDASPINGAIRPLTTKERSMVQTFPPSFNLVGSKTDIEQIIGNAVPVKLAEYVATRLKDYISAKSKDVDIARGKKSFGFALTPPPAARSRVMQAVRSWGNKSTELRLMELFKEHSIKGWRRKVPVFGRPDFVFPKKKIAVFADGCFWHGHNCRRLKPKTNARFWKEKFDRNMKRDRQADNVLRKAGWRVIRFWECELSEKSGKRPKMTALIKALCRSEKKKMTGKA